MKRKNLLLILVLLMANFTYLSAQNYANQTLKTIHERTSVREYSQKPVSQEILTELVKAGMAAPSAMNKQPWEFIIIQDRATLNKIGKTKPPVAKGQAAIAVLGNTKLSGSWVQDCSAAAENILLAATSMGLGTVWTGAYGNANFEVQLKELLKLPDGVMPLTVIAVGYPSGKTTPKNKFDKAKIHFDRY